MAKFDCDRTCKIAEICRFNAIFKALGGDDVVVMSHTVNVKTSLKDDEAMREVIKDMGGIWMGQGAHRLFESGLVNGAGFTLPGWTKMLVIQADGSLSYDDYKGRWGNVTDIAKLKSEYTIKTAMMAAAAQGWMTERVGDSLTVYHPSGGTITVSGASAEANGFMGVGCHDALMALGVTGEFTAKAEFSKVANECYIGK